MAVLHKNYLLWSLTRPLLNWLSTPAYSDSEMCNFTTFNVVIDNTHFQKHLTDDIVFRQYIVRHSFIRTINFFFILYMNSQINQVFHSDFMYLVLAEWHKRADTTAAMSIRECGGRWNGVTGQWVDWLSEWVSNQFLNGTLSAVSQWQHSATLVSWYSWLSCIMWPVKTRVLVHKIMLSSAAVGIKQKWKIAQVHLENVL